MMQIVINIPEDTYKDIIKNGFIYDEDNEVVTHAIKNGSPIKETQGREISEIKNELKDLSGRVENIENQIKEDKKEQLNRLKAEVDYAKFRCTLPF